MSLQSSLAAYWPMQGASGGGFYFSTLHGSATADALKETNGATTSQIVSGVVGGGGCITANGGMFLQTNSQTGDTNLDYDNQPITLSFWVNPLNFSIRDSGSTFDFGGYIGHQGAGAFKLSFGSAGASFTLIGSNGQDAASSMAITGAQLSLSTMNHLVGWYSPTSSALFISVNGSNASTATAASITKRQAGTPNFVVFYGIQKGGSTGTSLMGNQRTSMIIDEIALWKRELGSQELAALWNNGHGLGWPLNNVLERQQRRRNYHPGELNSMPF